MEISAPEMYDMYRKQSEHMKEADIPARVSDIKDAMSSSSYLKSLGATIEDNVIVVPDGDEINGFRGTFDRNKVKEGIPFVTWGNPGLDSFLEAVTDNKEPTGCIKRLVLDEDGIEFIGYAVATVDGIRLVTSYKELDDIVLNEQREITASELNMCRSALHERCEQERN